jgi:DNA-binding CsgD family transcriptional regulator
VPRLRQEIEVIWAIANGRTNNRIAAEAFISLKTLKSHLAGVQTKLRLRNRVEIARALETRLVDSHGRTIGCRPAPGQLGEHADRNDGQEPAGGRRVPAVYSRSAYAATASAANCSALEA